MLLLGGGGQGLEFGGAEGLEFGGGGEIPAGT